MVEYQTHGTKEMDVLDAQASFVPFSHNISSIFSRCMHSTTLAPPPFRHPPNTIPGLGW